MKKALIILGIGTLCGCAKPALIKPEAAPRSQYIERFRNQDEPEQLGLFQESERRSKGGDTEIKRMLERMKNDAAYSNQMMEQLDRL